jgi:phage shock protein C
MAFSRDEYGYVSHRPRGLYRSRRDRYFLGVCGGVAECFDFSPGALRLLTAILIFCSGIVPGILVYLIVGMIMKPMPDYLDWR